jgi:hypothetical protein
MVGRIASLAVKAADAALSVFVRGVFLLVCLVILYGLCRHVWYGEGP